MSRIIVPSKKTDLAVVDRIAKVDGMIESAYQILNEQIEKMRLMSKGATFTEKESRALQVLVKSLVELSAEERARLKNKEIEDLLSQLTDDEIKALKK